MSIPLFFYKLGHCPDLAIEEYYQISGSSKYQSDAAGWLLSNHGLNVNDTGAVVFGGKVYSHFFKKNRDKEIEDKLKEALSKFRSETHVNKIGLVLSKKYHQLGLDLAKEAGFKKINVINRLPNFGHWKSTQNWMVCFEFDKKEYYFGRVLTYSNQEFWASIDRNLPHGNMDEGMMNLKLARSLLNLTQKEKVWDPFCGPGRLVAVGLDLKKEFAASDIRQDSPEEVRINSEKARKIWHWGERFMHVELGDGPQIKTFALDAKRLSSASVNFSKNLNSDWAIVTEGYLGKNFSKAPSKKDIQIELSQLRLLWKKAIQEADKLQIPEIVFCLPLYLRTKETGEKWVWPQFEKELIDNTGYKLYQFCNGKTNILYSREKGFVGHLIMKLVR